MGDVFILGAGFSRAISPAMPVLWDLGEAVRERLNLPPAQDSVERDLELWLTYLSHDHPWRSEADNLRHHALLLDVSRAVGEVIGSRTEQALAEPCPEWLLNLVRWWDEHRSAVITLNYDTLVETAVGEATSGGKRHLWCGPLYPTPLTNALQRTAGLLVAKPVPTLQLYKLHGSVNWFYSGARSSLGETIYYCIAPPRWPPDESTVERVAQEAHRVSDKVPLVVAPVADKIPYFQHESIRALWNQAGQRLREATRVFSLGYSLPQTDITMRYFLRDNAPREPVKLYPVNRSEETGRHYRELLQDSFEVDTTFIGSDPIPRLAQALADGALA